MKDPGDCRMKWIILPLRRYAQFSGRSRRTEFWAFFLANLVLWIAFIALFVGAVMRLASNGMAEPQIIQAVIGSGISIGLFGLIYLALIIPWLALFVRRLHDIDFSGHWVWIMIGPWLASIVLTTSGAAAAIRGNMNASVLASGAGSALNLIAFLGWLVLMILALLPGAKGVNRFGEDPRGMVSAEVFA